ncbi:MAG: histidinol-phosphatase HisJ family protein [Defluviitaleaceae bacterium]|nr:histidinol-phosphatase HisJ family protein [Defluviitaleaceae bacterium]
MHFDSHVHSAASPDSELDPNVAIKVLGKKGLGVAFTEHVDFVTPIEGKDLSAKDAPNGEYDFICDFDVYPSQYKAIQDRYRDSVLLGIEIGLCAAYLDLNTQKANEGYDFVLGSIHNVDGYDVYSRSSAFEPEDFCRRYLTYGKEMVELCGFFDSYGHIDYIARYSEKIEKIFHYKNFRDEFDALLKALAERDLAMEINTSRFGKTSLIGQLTPIYKRFKELGGRYVTIGSDSHNEWALGRYYSEALGICKMTGLVPVYFRDRERILCDKT